MLSALGFDYSPRSIFLVFLCVLSLETCFSQQSDVVSRYVVVGVYSKFENATNRIEALKEEGIESSYIRFGYPDRRELNYVYVYESPDRAASLEESSTYRQQPGFEDTWVFVLRKSDPRDIEIGPAPTETARVVQSDEPEDEVTVQESSEVEKADDEVAPAEEQKGLESGLSEEGMEEEIHHEEEIDLEEEQEALAAAAAASVGSDYHKLFFRSFYMRNGREVEATIKMVDGQKSRLLTSKHSYELVNFLKRKDPGYDLQVVCEAFGYKKEVQDLNLTQPAKDNPNLSFNGDTLFVDFPLFRHNVGDTLIMFNVFFYNDSNIMRPKSKYELHELYTMMEENDQYHIAIHGHTNGNRRGRIIKMPDDETDFFTVREESIRTSGSAKELSKLRAESVKMYLASNGIQEDRMLVEGWGGKRMLYETNSRDAAKNARVEVVVLKE